MFFSPPAVDMVNDNLLISRISSLNKMEKCGKLKQEVVLGLLAVVDNFMRVNMFRFGDRIMNGARFASPGLIWEKGRCILSVEC